MSQPHLHKQSGSFQQQNRQSNYKIKQIWSMQQEIKQRFATSQINEKCFLLIGDTNVGKTTLLYYLSGMKLNLIKLQKTQTIQMEPQQIFQNAVVRNTLSTTQIPNIYLPKQGTEQKFTLIDMPGMNDHRFLSLISNIFTFELVFQKIEIIKKVHILFVISEQMFGAQQIQENLRQLVQHFNVHSFEQSYNISLIFTKTQYDEQDVTEKFFEYLSQVKQNCEESDEKEIMSMIALLEKMKQKAQDSEDQKFIYVFPREEPVQSAGQQIMINLLKRNKFTQRQMNSILNQNFISQILQNMPLKSQSFLQNFIDLTQNTSKFTIEIVSMLLDLTKLMHKYVQNTIYPSQQTFNKDFESFCQSYYPLFQIFAQSKKMCSDNKQQSQARLDRDQFKQLIYNSHTKITNEAFICLLDKQVKELLDIGENQSFKNLEESQTGKKSQACIQQVQNILKRIVKIYKSVEINEKILNSTNNILKYLDWLSEAWYSSMNQIKQLPKLQQKIRQFQDQFINFIKCEREQTKKDSLFYEILTKLSQKQCDDDSEEQGFQAQIQIIEIVLPRINLEKKKQKYLRQRYQQQVKRQLQTSSGSQSFTQNQKAAKYTDQEIMNLIRSTRQDMKSLMEQQQFNDSEQIQLKIARALFVMRRCKHPEFLKQALENFTAYLNFINKVSMGLEKKHFENLIKEFINNLCSILDVYRLIEQQVLLRLFINDWEAVKSALRRGFQFLKINRQFLQGQLIKILFEIASHPCDYEVFKQIQNIIVECYDYLISSLSSNRKEQKQLQHELEQQIKKIDEAKKYLKTPGSSRQFPLNYSILFNELFNPRKISLKWTSLNNQINSRLKEKSSIVRKIQQNKYKSLQN